MLSLLHHHVILHRKHATLISSPSLLLTFDMFTEKTTLLPMLFLAWISIHSMLSILCLLSAIPSSHRPNRMTQVYLNSSPHPCISKLCPCHFPLEPYSAIRPLPHHAHTFLHLFAVVFLTSFTTILTLESVPLNS